MAYRIGISYWHIVLAYRIGISNCVLDVKLPFIQEIVLSNCMFECQFVCFDVKMYFNIYILILASITLHSNPSLNPCYFLSMIMTQYRFDLILNSLGTVATSVKGLIYSGPCIYIQ